MSAEIVSTADGILTVKMAGKLAQPEMAAMQRRATEILAQNKKMPILVLAQGFEGWEKSGNWGDLTFPIDSDEHIAKMAIVGEKKWEDRALLYAAKGLRSFPVEYFLPGQEAKARAWLTIKC